MKVIGKSVFLGAALIGAMAMTAVPSEAAKKRAAKCDMSRACAANCKGNTCELRRCDADGKTYVFLPLFTCVKGVCPQAC